MSPTKTSTKRSEQHSRSWLREAISDEDGQADIAYIAIGALTVSALVTLAYIVVMSTVDWAVCLQTTVVNTTDTAADTTTHVTAVIPCRFDGEAIGKAAGLLFAAFAALIGALAGYMAATRRRDHSNGGNR